MISAVILSYNRRDEVLFTIDRLKETKATLPYPLEIIVVDNASVDDTSYAVSMQHPDITLITKPVNNGIAGWNEGFKVARHKYILVLDDDSHIDYGLEGAIARLEASPEIGLIALHVSTGPYITTGIWEDDEDLIGFVGCGAIFRREVYEKVGGFAEWLLVYGHEWEFGIRVLDQGYRISYFPDSNVLHRASNINRSPKRLLMYSMRNEMGLVYKYFGADRGMFLRRMVFNTFKRVKDQGFKYTYYNLLGVVEFLKIKDNIDYTPVSARTQEFFASKYWGTQPFFKYIKLRFQRLIKQI